MKKSTSEWFFNFSDYFHENCIVKKENNLKAYVSEIKVCIL